MQSEFQLLNNYAKLHFTNLMKNKIWVIDGKGGGINNLASEWASGQHRDRKRIKPIDLLVKNYASVIKVQKNYFIACNVSNM